MNMEQVKNCLSIVLFCSVFHTPKGFLNNSVNMMESSNDASNSHGSLTILQNESNNNDSYQSPKCVVNDTPHRQNKQRKHKRREW